MNKKERIIFAMGDIDEKYVQEADVTMKRQALIPAAVCFVLILSLSLYLFIPFAPVTSNLKRYEASSYYPLIEEIDQYRLSFMQPSHKNNFEVLGNNVSNLLSAMFSPKFEEGMNGGAAPEIGDNGSWMPDGSSSGNGNYIESTDNQVEGVIESDIFKMTDKYIFRLAWRSDVDHRTPLLRVYSVAKVDSELVTEFEIPRFENESLSYFNQGEMYLSSDGNTITIIKNYTNTETSLGKVGVISLDVSSISDISVKSTVSIDGKLNTSRMVDGKLILISEFSFNRGNVDYADPTTFVPTIDSGNGPRAIEFEDIIYPESIGNTRYSVVAMMDSEDLELLGASALLNYTEEVYVSENKVYITRPYTESIQSEEDQSYKTTRNMTEIAILDYSGDELVKCGTIKCEGSLKDQYSFDEKDGYLRVVSSTNERKQTTYEDTVSSSRHENVSLFIYNLTDNSLAYAVRDFALEGEEATAVRFMGDKLYVCTAVVVTFTDPVYFFDLSDYESIDHADTGIIEGFSTSLIDLGEGFLLGIGRESGSVNKVEIYEQQGDQVVSVAKYKFYGNYSQEYKSYLINREKNIFAFAVEYFCEANGNGTGTSRKNLAYVILQFNGYEINAEYICPGGISADNARAAYLDGYIYLTTEEELYALPLE